MTILFGKITPALGLIEFAQIGTGKRPRTLEIRQVVTLFRERLHMLAFGWKIVFTRSLCLPATQSKNYGKTLQNLWGPRGRPTSEARSTLL